MVATVWLIALATPVWSAEVDQFRGQGPSRVVMQTLTGDTCVTADIDGETAMALKPRHNFRYAGG